MLCEKNGKRNSETERRIYASGDKLTASLTTVTDPSLPLRMTINVSLTMTPCECIAV